ncbi:hypothetical protein FGM00_13065 [Aggregatimonas sangjinii]|uniref:Uncharacterized protein n=1 Tax=Aggregatimonas sangjinii TaxID=2583587 RepID=A0A5B7SQU8_9FLAO|nr:hypothetical protein [Aggregatimonas sangjinii]QCX00996.1 hypothetical protein FGM00_13065 [Aggregatimonas sangjinii]
MKYVIAIYLLLPILSLAQPNCEAYKYDGKMSLYSACKKAEESQNYYQFTREYQEILDEALKIDSSYAYAYQAKGYAYLKSGDFVTWNKLLGKAIKYNEVQHLGYRGWCRYQFFRDYKGAIADIERLEEISKWDIGVGQNGDYHLIIAKALCYKGLGHKAKAIEIIEQQLKLEDHYVGLYDYLHLGVLYLESQKYDRAIEAFKIQKKENTLADNEFYMAMAYKALNDIPSYRRHLQESHDLYQNSRHMFDPYTHQMDRVFLSDIEAEMQDDSFGGTPINH